MAHLVRHRTPAGDMATTEVADLDQFLRTFSTIGVEKRKEHGCKGAYVFRDPDDPDRVWIFFDWGIEDYQGFLSDPEDPLMGEARDHPRHHFVHGDVCDAALLWTSHSCSS